MTPDPKQEGKLWMGAARQDLEGAKILQTAKLHNLACFHCQQAAEKALKAILYSAGAKRAWTHSVHDLSIAVGQRVPGAVGLPDDAARLDLYYTPARYPNGSSPEQSYSALGDEDSTNAIRIAEQIVHFAEQTIPRLLSE